VGTVLKLKLKKKTKSTSTLIRKKSEKLRLKLKPRVKAQGKSQQALDYQKRGFSVIPVMQNKKPYVKWTQFQDKKADAGQVRKWWKDFPGANVGIVTGSVSGIDVIDCDSEAGKATLNEHLADAFKTPQAKTPKGYHYYFKHKAGLSNGVRVMKDCDVRTTGGYVIAPPSNNGNGKTYAWMKGSSIDEVALSEMPQDLRARLAGTRPHLNKVGFLKKKYIIGEDVTSSGNKAVTNGNKYNISFGDGRKDVHLFHTANCLIKGGMQRHNVMKILEMLASTWGEENEKKWLSDKVLSALNRSEKNEKSLTAEIRDLISITSGNISTTFVSQTVTSITSDRKKVNTILWRLAKEGLLERTGRIAGEYRKIEADCDKMDFMKAGENVLDIWLPFQLNELVNIMPGNIIVVAGTPDAGKTAMLLNVVKENMNKFDVHYFNSEMGDSELKLRLEKFPHILLDQWNFTAWERSENFGDVVKNGPGAINIIDFLEIYENFYEVSKRIYEIWKKLDGAIAIIALQKNTGIKFGLGGQRGLEKPRLYLSVDNGCTTITKGKNWATARNPNGLQYKYKIVNGCQFIDDDGLGWHKPED